MPKVTLFIQDVEGDHNFERVFSGGNDARAALYDIKDDGGYWTEKKNGETGEITERIFLPWHRISFARIEPIVEDK